MNPYMKVAMDRAGDELASGLSKFCRTAAIILSAAKDVDEAAKIMQEEVIIPALKDVVKMAKELQAILTEVDKNPENLHEAVEKCKRILAGDTLED